MEDKRIYLLAQFDEATNQRLTGIYNKLVQSGISGKQTQNLPYHFTLGSFDPEYEVQVIQRAQDVCSKTYAFDIHLNHIGLFGLSVLFIAPSMNQELLDLHNAMLPNEPASGVHNWVAHATLLIDEPDTVHKAIPIVSKSFSSLLAKIDSIGVYEFFPSKLIAGFKLIS